MLDPWLPILQDLPLSKAEKEIVKRYEADPQGRTFLPVADILKAHQKKREGLEMLIQGVERHPSYVVARVVLARELLNKGMVSQAWRTLEDSPSPIRENLLAQKLRFRLALLLELEDIVQGTYAFLNRQQMLDNETRKLGMALESAGLLAAKQKLINDFSRLGIDLDIPTPEAVDSKQDPGLGPQKLPELADDVPTFLGDRKILQSQEVTGFHVMALREVFRGDGQAATQRRDDSTELDTLTLANIYEKQGYYGKALTVYKRLLKSSPQNDRFLGKVRELSRLEKEQRQRDLNIDPAIIDKMETIEIIDRQIEFYQELLQNLDQRES